MVLVLSLAPPSRKWLMLACGWGEFEVAWWESPERLGPPPSKRSLDQLLHLPPFIFSQDFILAKSGLIRAAFTKLLPHFSQRGVKSYLQPPHNTIIYHKSSCCIYPTPHPLEALRAWDQVRMPLWVLLPPCGCPFKKEATLCIWFLSLPLAPPTLVQKPIFLQSFSWVDARLALPWWVLFLCQSAVTFLDWRWAWTKIMSRGLLHVTLW